MRKLRIVSIAVLGCVLVGGLVSTVPESEPQTSQQASSGGQIGQAWAYSEPSSKPTVKWYGLGFTQSYSNCALAYYDAHRDIFSTFKDVLFSPIVKEECQNG